jgi:hypothetical protein
MSKKLEITNKKVIDFYEKNSSFDFENVNLSIVNMLEHIIDDTQNKLSSSAISQLHHLLNEYNNKIDLSLKNIEHTNHSLLRQFDTTSSDLKDNLKYIRDIILTHKHDLENMVVSKLSSIKQQYLDDLKVLFQLHEQNSLNNTNSIIFQLSPKFDNINEQLISKLNSTLIDIFPKFSDPLIQQLSNNTELFKSSINLETQKITELIKTSDNTSILNSFINNFNFRFSELIKGINEPIISFITCSEERIKNNIDTTVRHDFDHILDNIKSSFKSFDTQINSINNKLDTNNNDTLKSFITNEILTILNNVNTTNSIETINNFINTFDERYTNIIQSLQNPILQTINTTEDRVIKNIDHMKSIIENNHSITDNLNKNFNEHLNKYKNSSMKGLLSEARLFNELTRYYPEAEIISTGQENKSGDILFKRTNKKHIRFENKEYSYNIPETEIDKFKRDILYCNDANGIFISQISGIANREDWTIELHNEHFILYLQNVNNDIDKIKMAVNIIDLLDKNLSKTKINNDDNNNNNNYVYNINEDELLEINNEIALIVSNKTKLIEHINDMRKIVELIELPSLNRIISSTNILNNNTNYFLCDLCDYKAKTKRAITAHKNHKHMNRYFKNSNEIIISNNDNSTDNTHISTTENELSSNIIDDTKSENIETTSITITKKRNTRKK